MSAPAAVTPTSFFAGNSTLDAQGRVLTLSSYGQSGGAAFISTMSRVALVLFRDNFENSD
jgi:hypothetical protein